MSRRRRNTELWWILGAGVAAAVLTPFVVDSLVEPSREAPSPRADATRSVGSAQVQSASSPSEGAPTPARSPELPAIKLAPPYEVSDGLTIMTERTRVRLAGLEGPAREAACFDSAGNLWGCGLQARAALNNLIRTKEIVCRPNGQKVGEAPVASCTIGRERLDRALVAQGFARPTGDDPGLARDLADAKSGARGLWNGGWRIRAP